MGPPPLELGTVQLTPADPSPEVAVTVDGGVGTPAWAEFGSTINPDSSMASKALAGTVLSWDTMVGYAPEFQPASSVPVKNQLDPLSATMSPKCFIAVSTTLASAPNVEMS